MTKMTNSAHTNTYKSVCQRQRAVNDISKNVHLAWTLFFKLVVLEASTQDHPSIQNTINKLNTLLKSSHVCKYLFMFYYFTVDNEKDGSKVFRCLDYL